MPAPAAALPCDREKPSWAWVEGAIGPDAGGALASIRPTTVREYVTPGRALTVMKRDKNLAWRRVDPSSLDLKGMKVAVIGGTGGIGRAFSRFMASRGASILVVGQTFR
jgi:hypothetical protein